jgi:hypothetical protein
MLVAAAVEFFAAFATPGKFAPAPTATRATGTAESARTARRTPCAGTVTVFGGVLLPFGARGSAFGVVEFAVMVRVETLQHLFAERTVFAFRRRGRRSVRSRLALRKGRQGE